MAVRACDREQCEGEGGEEEKEADGTTAVVCASLDEELEGGLGSEGEPDRGPGCGYHSLAFLRARVGVRGLGRLDLASLARKVILKRRFRRWE